MTHFVPHLFQIHAIFCTSSFNFWLLPTFLVQLKYSALLQNIWNIKAWNYVLHIVLFCWSSPEEITHVQGKRNPRQMVDAERGHQRADRLKTQSQTTSQSDHVDHNLV